MSFKTNVEIRYLQLTFKHPHTFYIPSLLNDMKIVVQKNHLGVKFYTEVLTLLKTASNAAAVNAVAARGICTGASFNLYIYEF